MEGMPVLTLRALNLHWLGNTTDPADLCVHGTVYLAAGEQQLLSSGVDELAVSTGALHLLRSLSEDHTRDHPIAEQLIPCCGHAMSVDVSTGQLTNIGCNVGANWWVIHDPVAGTVELQLPTGMAHRVRASEWRAAACAFSEDVAEFIAASPARHPSSAEDAEWYPVFLAEWSERRRAVCGLTPVAADEAADVL